MDGFQPPFNWALGELGMRNLVISVFVLICFLVLLFEDIKAEVTIWFLTLLALNLVALFVLIIKPFRIEKPNNTLRVLLFPLVSFSTYIFWIFILNEIPIYPSGTPPPFLSFLMPAVLASLCIILILAIPVALIFGSFGFLISVSAMFMMMFTYESWFQVNGFLDRIVLYENLCLGIVVSISLYYSNEKLRNLVT